MKITADTVTFTLDEALDAAVESLPFFRERVMRRRLRNDEVRKGVLEDVQMKFHDDPRVQEFIPQAVFASSAFNADTPITVPIRGWETIIQLLLENLPSIIEMIMKLFASSLLPFAIVTSLALSGSALAAPPVVLGNCPSGLCVLQSTARVIRSTPRRVVTRARTVAATSVPVVKTNVVAAPAAVAAPATVYTYTPAPVITYPTTVYSTVESVPATAYTTSTTRRVRRPLFGRVRSTTVSRTCVNCRR